MSSERTPAKKAKISDANNTENAADTEFDDAVIELEMCQNELDKINEKENEEVIAMDMKYRKQRQELYDKRSTIIDKIPDFWFTVFIGHPDLCNMLTEEEEDCLHYLKKVEVALSDTTSGYSIHFHFKENPHFRNTVLTKEIAYNSDAITSTSTTIDWIKMPKKQTTAAKNTPTGGQKNKRFRDEPKSFFQWYANNEDPVNDRMAEMVKDDVWPNCLQYYLPDPDVEGEEESGDSSEECGGGDDDEANGAEADDKDDNEGPDDDE